MTPLFYPRKELIPTKPCAGHVLATARNAVGLYQYQAAQLLSKDEIISEDTISNWECNRAMPDPEQVSAMERVYECEGLWDSWMRLQWPSYRAHIPENPDVSSAGLAVINAGYQISDVAALTEALGRDLMDGRVDDAELKARYIAEAEEAAAALQAAISKLRKGV